MRIPCTLLTLCFLLHSPLIASDLVWFPNNTITIDRSSPLPLQYETPVLMSRGQFMTTINGYPWYEHEWTLTNPYDFIDFVSPTEQNLYYPAPVWPTALAFNLYVDQIPGYDNPNITQTLLHFPLELPRRTETLTLIVTFRNSSQQNNTKQTFLVNHSGLSNLQIHAGSYFTKRIEIWNLTSSTTFRLSESSPNIRLSTSQIHLGTGGRFNVYVRGSAYKNGSTTISITNGIETRRIPVRWSIQSGKRGVRLMPEIATQVDHNRNGQLEAHEIEATQALDLSNLGLKQVDGLEAFGNLVLLDLSGNPLIKLPDLEALQNLETLILDKAHHNGALKLPPAIRDITLTE